MAAIRALRRFAEVFIGTLMALMFLTFVLQITIRYTARLGWIAEAVPLLDPTRYGWTLEFCLLLWVWIIFAGCAFVVRDEDHVTFDMLFNSVGPGLRRWFLILGSLAIVIGLAASILPTWDKFHILRLKQTATLKQLLGDWVRMRDVYSVYILFLIAVSLRYAVTAWQALRSGPPDIHRGPAEGPDAVSSAFILCLGTILVIAGIGMPIAYAILIASLLYLFASGGDIGLAGKVLMDGLYNSFLLLAVPLFIVAANIMNAGTISDRLLAFCVALVGRFRGGLGHVNVVASLIFSGMSGSAVADAAGIGKIIINMMTRSGHYTRGYAAAITAASATIGPIIPPSIPMVLYALVSNSSIGYLFLGGIVPGLMMGLVLMTMNTIISHKRGFALEEPVPLRQLPAKTLTAFPALLMPAILLYGIYGGVTTPTEAAAVAAFYALVLAAVFYRALSLGALGRILVESARSSAAVGLVIGGALILNYVVASENIPNLLAERLVGLDVHPLVFLLCVNLLLLLLGCVLDATTIILVIIPLFLPTCRELGIDLVHFGVVAVVNCMIGLITPPYGILLFVINAVTRIPLAEIIREIWLFLAVLIAALAAMILFPGIVLWLPRVFGYPG